MPRADRTHRFTEEVSKVKSAYELAMERMIAENGPAKQLTAEEKERLAEVDRKYDARSAESKLGFEDRLAKAATYAELQELREQMAAELKGIEEKRESEKERIWGGSAG
ncbi:MAG: hypothetical protein HYV27_14685 [Candidatus Hydrogenedentes bacterium]|nr:hypothetical protein [Candidatus Hydrogenedentota bacterium]